MKKGLYLFATILEALCLAGAYAVQYFTRKKMGMARYVVYKNRAWEAEYPMQLLTRIIPLALLILAAVVFLIFLRRRRRTKGIVLLMSSVMILLAAVYAGFTFISSTENMRAYYFISAILAVVSLIQSVKAFTGILVCKNET